MELVVTEVQKDNVVRPLVEEKSSEASENENEFGVSGEEVTDNVGEKIKEEKTSETESKVEKEKVEVKEENPDELAELRQLAREQKRQLDALGKQLEDTNKKLQDAQIITPEEVEKNKETQLLILQRNEQLENILEIMRLNPKYEDIDTVVSQANFDDMVEAMAKVVVDKEGGKLSDVVRSIEGEIWSMRNPYRFMYDQIKKYHPKFKETISNEKPADKKDLSAQKIATSLQDIPVGGGKDSGGWTAAKIDLLDESELDKVPPDIYKKYLLNQLK